MAAEIPLIRLPLDFKYHMPLQDGNLVMHWGQRRTTLLHLTYATEIMTPNEIVAITLTEAGIKHGIGKVFWLPSQQVIGSYKHLEFGPIPDLVYQRYSWTEDEKAAWWLKSHEDRWLELRGEMGWLDDSIPVLPINLNVQSQNANTFTFRESLASVGLHYRPDGVYVDWFREWDKQMGKNGERCQLLYDLVLLIFSLIRGQSAVFN
ncbi:MAG: hypothetical protein Q9187_003948 [Circinaria calcarea]